MAKITQLRIGDVVARTGLTERMIRHYETLGLVRPDRSPSGQRLYDADALLALGKVRLLKQAGLPLNMIERWLANPMDARGLIAAQLDYLRSEACRIADAIQLLSDIDGELAHGGEADVDHLARVIASSQDTRDAERAKAFFEKHFTPAQRDEWQEMMGRLRQEVDPEAYDADWRALIVDIKAALPLDPKSDAAHAFVDRWNALMAPFRRAASPEQQALGKTMWENVGEWGAHVQQPATQDVMDFIREALSARANPSSQTSTHEPNP